MWTRIGVSREGDERGMAGPHDRCWLATTSVVYHKNGILDLVWFD